MISLFLDVYYNLRFRNHRKTCKLGSFSCSFICQHRNSYKNPYYVIDMITLMVIKPLKAKKLWHELNDTLKGASV